MRWFYSLLLAAGLAAVLWLLLSAPASRDLASEPTMGTHEEAVSEAMAEGMNSQGAMPNLEQAAREELKTKNGHQILVLDPAGVPMPGVRLWVRVVPPELEDDLLPYWRKEPEALKPWTMQGRYPSVRADHEGLARLDERGAVAVAAITPHAMGALALAPMPEGEAALEPNVLQLQPMPMIEAIAMDETGQAVVGQELELRFANLAALAELTDEARLLERDRGGAWEEGQLVQTDEDGRAYFPLDFSSEVRDRLGVESAWIGEVSTDIAVFGPVRVEFAMPRAQPVELTLPATGTLELELQGFPPQVVPILVDPENRSRQDLKPVHWDGSSRARFEPLAVGAPVRVFFYAVSVSEETGEIGDWSLLTLPDLVIDGPERAGEVTTRVLQFQRPPGVYGQLVLPEHRRAGVAATDPSRRGFRVRAMLKEETMRPYPQVAMSLFADGSFSLAPHQPHQPEQRIEWKDVDRLLFEWMPMRFSERDPGSEAERRTLFAAVPLALQDSEAVHEIGAVHLAEDPYLLHVTTLDETGKRVAGVNVSLGFTVEGEGGSTVAYGASPRWLHSDEDGETWFQDFDWNTEFGRNAKTNALMGQPVQLVVWAQKEGYVQAEQHIPFTQREVELQLQRAGRAEGSFEAVPGLDQLWISWLPAGASSAHGEADSVARWVAYLQHVRANDEGFVEFEIESIPAGVWDVVFSTGANEHNEVYRVAGVEVSGGETCRDPRLQKVALASRVGVHRFRFADPQGKRLTPPQLQGQVTYRVTDSLRTTSGYQTWIDGELCVSGNFGTQVDAYLVDSRWLSVPLQQSAPGTHRLTVYPRRELPVVVDFAELQPEVAERVLTLESLQPPRETLYIELDADGRGTANLPAAGSFRASWSARLNGTIQVRQAGTVDFSAQQITEATQLRFDWPEGFPESLIH